MEVAGLAVSIVSLYNATVDVLGRVEAYKNFGTESQTNFVHFEAAKIRLQDWADSVGIQNGQLADRHNPRLDDLKRASIIKTALEGLTKLFDDVERTSSSINLPTRRPTADADIWLTPFDDVRSKPEHHQAGSKRSRLAWAMGGKEKLNKNVVAFDGLITVLYHVANPSDVNGDHFVSTLSAQENEETLAASGVALKSAQESLIALERRDLFDWLDALKYDDEYEKHLSSHLDGTCQWILRHPTFSKWESNENLDTGAARFLWVHGPAGFGKTVLSAWLIRHTKEALKLPVAYCFSSSHAQRAEEFDSIIRTWITQLAERSIETLNVCQTTHRKLGGRRASRADVWSLLKHVLLQAPSCILALDGLDEFRDVDGTRGLFLENLKNAVASTRVRLLITSRDEPDIEVQLGASATLPQKYTMLECKVSKEDVLSDVGLYSQSVVAKQFPRRDESFREDLSAQIADRADGMFLWIKLQQGQLRGSQSRKTVQRIVEGMPHGLSQTYNRNWKTIQELAEPDRDRAINILRWLTFGFGSLTVQQLVEALVISLNDTSEAFDEEDLPEEIDAEYINDEIKGLCCSFIELREGTKPSELGLNTVHLAHGSIREYLVTVLPVPLKASLPISQDSKVAAHHAILAAYCLRFLNCVRAWERKDLGGYRAATAYAIHSWFGHVRESGEYEEHIAVSSLLLEFLRSQNVNFRCWRTQYEEDCRSHDSEAVEELFSAIYYASLFRLHPALDFLLDTEGEHINSVGGPHGTPLQIACVSGDQVVFDHLMRRGVDVTVQGGTGDTAISAAARWGHYDMIRSLLEREVLTDQSSSRIRKATEVAASEGYADVVKLLLDHGEVTGSGDVTDQKKLACLSGSLLEAADCGHLNVVKLLLDRGADVNIRNQDNDAPLHLSAEMNHLDVVVYLISQGASPVVRGRNGFTPLHYAASRGHTVIATYLLAHDADLDARSDAGNTALILAVQEGYLDVARLLLDQNADVDISDADGFRATHTAALLGFVPLLVQRGADVNAQNTRGMSPLHSAVWSGHTAAAEVLLQYGAESNARDEDGDTPLHDAFLRQEGFNDHQLNEIIGLLLKHGANPNILNNHGETPLFLSVKLENIDHLRSLISTKGCDINAKGMYGMTLLSMAIEFAPDDFVEDLIQRGADLSAIDYFGMTCLDWIKRLRPRLLESPTLCQSLDKGTSGPDIALLRRNTSELAAGMRSDIQLPDFEYFAKCLIMLDMERDATLALQLDKLACLRGAARLIHVCDGCDEEQTGLNVVYTCKSCPDTDLCPECMTKYEEKPVIKQFCKGHSFSKVDASEARLRLDQTEEINAWLFNIEERLKSADASESVHQNA
ncbi:MAG: hypothetical protein Q9178_003774 [Gyalolechia marmorata]